MNLKTYAFMKLISLLISFAIPWFSYSQNYNSYADFHIHVAFKNYNRHIIISDSILNHANDGRRLNALYGDDNWKSLDILQQVN